MSYVPSENEQRILNNDVRHQYRVLNDAEKKAMIAVKDQGLTLLHTIELCVPEGRERSLAKTKVEEAVMWAVKGLTA